MGILCAFTLAAAASGCSKGGGGGSSSTSTISGAPTGMTYSANPAYYAINTAITPDTVAAGSGINSFTVTPALPTGLSLDPTSGTISGTPTLTQPPTQYTVEGVNSYGENFATLTIAVVNGIPAISYAGPYTGYRDSAFSTVNVSNTGGWIESCSISPALPAGLSFDTSTCAISGTPSALASNTTYTVTATNLEGSSAPASFQLQVIDQVPVLSYPSGTHYLTHNQAATPIDATNTGGPISSGTCQVTPALPAGLSLNADTCQITGTPTVTSAATAYSVKAQNSAGWSASASVTIEIDAAPPILSYSPGSYTLYDTKTTNLPIVATLGGDPITGCTALNPLPAGLSVNSANCDITGTPTAAAATAYYDIQASNGTQTATAMVQITVQEIAPAISFVGSPYTEYVGKVMTPIGPGNTGGPITSCSISPTLPAGMSIATNCQISGTPSVTSPATNYTVTATNSAGNSQATINIQVQTPPNPPNLSYTAPATYTYSTDGTAITPVDALNPSPAGAPTSCTASPTLPTGLSVAVNAGTCEISGTPTQVVGTTTYTVTGTNPGGSSSANVTITVNDVPPNISYPGSPYVFAQNQAIAPITVTNNPTPANEGAIVSCTSNPPLPAGLTLSNTCGITGTPTVIQAATNYNITATNTGGSSSANISIAVDGVPTFTPLADSTYPVDGANPPLIEGNSYTIVTASDPSGGNVTMTCTFETVGLNASDPNYAASGTDCATLNTLTSTNGTTVVAADAVSGSGTASPSFTWTPTSTQRGTYQFSFTATNTVGSATQTVNVTVREPDTKTNLLSGFDALDATNASVFGSSVASAPFTPADSATKWLQLLSAPSDATLDFTGSPTPWSGTGQDSSSSVDPYRLSYGGASDYLSVGTALSSATEVALETWIKPGSPAGAARTIAGNGGGIADGLALMQSTLPTGYGSFVVGQKYYSYRDLVLQDQPSSYWRLDESSGTTASDLSIYGNTGTYSGGYTQGASGATTDGDAAVTLNGSSGYVYTTNSYNDPTAFSVEVWFNTTTSPGKIIGFENTRTGSGSNYDRQIYLGNGGEICFGVYDGRVNEICTSGSYKDGNWHHAVGTFASNILTFYVDGSLATVGSQSACKGGAGANPCTIAGPIQSYTGYWKIGYGNLTGWNDGPGGASFFKGSIDEPAIYSYVLTAAQVANHYQTGKNGNYVAYPGNAILADGPSSYWRLGEQTGTSATDDSGNSNTGTYNGSVTLAQTGALANDSDTAAAFDGSSAFVSTTSSYANPTSFSIEIWFNTSTGSGGGMMGFSTSQSGTTGGTNDREIYMSNNGKLTFNVGGTKITSGSAYNNGAWHQAVGTCSSAGMILYVDGSSVATSASCSPSSSTGYWRIGQVNGISGPGVGSNYLAGTLDEAAFYNYPLTATQVATHYNSGSGPGWWTCLSRTALSSSSWNLLQGVWDGTNATLYVNGQEECQVAPGTTYSGSAANTFAGADSSQTSSSFWQGAMSTLKIFGTSDGVTNPLPASSAQADFSAEANRFRQVPVENIYTSGLVLSLDAANAAEGLAPDANGCASSELGWFDLSPSAANGTLTGFSSCGAGSGWVGSGTVASPFALAFNGTANSVSFNQGTNLGTNYSVEAWVQASSFANNKAMLSNGTVYLGAANGSKWQFNSVTSTSTATTGQWYHVVGVQSGSSETLYVNGSSAGTATGSVSFASGAATVGSGSAYFKGQIATLRVYSGALTQQQVKQNCLAQELRFTSTPQSICAAP